MNDIEGVIAFIEKSIKGFEGKHTPLSPLDRGEI